MKTKQIPCLIAILLFCNSTAYSKDNDTIPWLNLVNAIHEGFKLYTTSYSGTGDYLHEDLHDGHIVFIIKIISISKNKGEFSISYIMNDVEFKEINASHWLFINNRLVLFRTDELEDLFTEKSGIPKITKEIRKLAYDILAGPNIFITKQPSSIMVFKYKRKNLSNEYYSGISKIEEKYHYFNNIR